MFFERGKSVEQQLPTTTFGRAQPISQSGSHTSAITILVAAALVIVIFLVPVASHAIISLYDVYNHIARAVVLLHYDNVAFQEYWVPSWRFVPYAGFDLLSMALLTWLSTGIAVKILFSISIITLFGGALLLSRVVHGRLPATALLTALFLLNRDLLSGIINYLFGLGVMFAGLAAWIALRDRSAPVRLIILVAFAMATCIIHPLSCIVLGISVVGIELANLIERRSSLLQIIATLLVPAAAFLPAVFCLIFLAPHPRYQSLIIYGSLFKHITAFAVPLTYAPVFEALGFLAIGIFCLVCWATGRLHLDHRLLGAAVLLALVQLMVPEQIGVTSMLDHRIPIAFWIILVCAMEIRITRSSVIAGLAVTAATLFVSRTALTQVHWTRDNMFYQEARKILSSLPPHSRIGTAYDETDLKAPTNTVAALHDLPALELVPKGDYVQTLFTMADQHPLLTRPPFAQLADATLPGRLWQAFVVPQAEEAAGIDAETVKAVDQYDYLVFVKPTDFTIRPTRLLTLVGSGPGIQVYSVRHDSVPR